MDNSLDNVERICNKESLQAQLSFMALFIGMFEFMKDALLSRVESFLCSNMTRNEDGEWVYIHNDTYKNEIEKRFVDGKIVKDRLRNTVLWFKDAEAITDDDYELFRKLRNISRRGFQINGAVHAYPDIIAMTTSGKILMIETKGDHLENEESKAKAKIGSQWSSLAGSQYRYFMVFQSKTLDWPGAYSYDRFMEIVKGL